MLRGVYQGKEIGSEGSGVLGGRLCSRSFYHISRSGMLCYERKMLSLNVLVGKAAWDENDLGIQRLRIKHCVKRCSCEAGQGRCHHLLALAYAVLSSMKKSDDASARTSKPQQWHVPRAAKIDLQPWLQLTFSKPLVEKESARGASLCLCNPRSLKRKDSEESKQIFQEFQDKFRKVCPTAPVVHVENDSSTTIKTNFAEYLQGSPLSYQLPSVDCIGIQTKIYGELPFELPVLSDYW